MFNFRGWRTTELEPCYGSAALAYAGPSQADRFSKLQYDPSDSARLASHSRSVQGSSEESDATAAATADAPHPPQRVGGPDLARPPFGISILPSKTALHRAWLPWLREAVQEIIERRIPRGTKHCDICCDKRGNAYDDQDNFRPTIWVLVEALAEDDSWQLAYQEIRELCTSNGFHDVVVDLMYAWIVIEQSSLCVEESHPLFPLWPTIRSAVVHILRGRDWSAVEALRRGYDVFSNGLTREKTRVTIVVTVTARPTDSWHGLLNEIVAVLNQHQLVDVAVEIVDGSIMHSSEGSRKYVWPEIEHGLADLGASIGAVQHSRSGRLAGYLELQLERDGPWQRFGLTCYHCAAPSEPSAGARWLQDRLWHWREHGLRPLDVTAAASLIVTQPAEVDLRRHLEEEKKSLAQEKARELKRTQECIGRAESISPDESRSHQLDLERIANWETSLATTLNFVLRQEHLLGSVWAGSGQRRSAQKMMDWALLAIRPDRQGVNQVSDEGTRSRRIYFYPDDGIVRFIRRRSIDHEGSLHFPRRDSGTVEGGYNSLMAAVRTTLVDRDGNKRTEETIEHSIPIGCRRRCGAGPDDTGTMVHDMHGRMVGLFVALNSASRVAYFTHVDDLFADIKEMTGAVKIRLPPEGVENDPFEPYE